MRTQDNEILQDRKDTVKMVAAIITAFMLVVFLPIHGWFINKTLDFMQDMHARVTVLERQLGSAVPINEEQLIRSFEPIVEKVNDHELRIRKVEATMQMFTKN